MKTANRSHANTVGAIIRAGREALGLSQSGLARACEWPGDEGKSRISRYERGVRTPSYTDAQTLGAALGIAPHTLLTGEEVGETIQRIPLERITRDEEQPRSRNSLFTEAGQAAIEHLAESIREHGVLQPITVRPNPQHDIEGERFLVVYGERRYCAAQKAGLDSIPAIVRTDIDDAGDRLAVQIIENLQRVDLSLPELITGISRLALTRNHEQIATELGRSRSWVSRRHSLNDCTAEVWQLIADDKIRDVDAAHALDQLFDLERDVAEDMTRYLREGGTLSRDWAQRLVKDAKGRLDHASEQAAAEREAAEAQRRAEEQRANDTAGGYDGPTEDTDADTGPAEVTGREGTHSAEREAAPDPGESAERASVMDRFDVQALVNAQVDVNRAVFERNRTGYAAGHPERREPEPTYLRECIGRAITSLQRALASLETATAQPPEPWADDPLYDNAVTLVRDVNRCSISELQRRLRTGYNRAAGLVDAMENAGVVSALQPNGTRDVLAAGKTQ